MGGDGLALRLEGVGGFGGQRGGGRVKSVPCGTRCDGNFEESLGGYIPC